MGLPSVALGIFPLLVPRATARAIGLQDNRGVRTVLRVLGIRELVVAAIVMARPRPVWLWGFVAQDALDLPLCGWLLATRRAPKHDRFRTACAVYVGLATIDVYTAVTRNTDRQATSLPDPSC